MPRNSLTGLLAHVRHLSPFGFFLARLSERKRLLHERARLVDQKCFRVCGPMSDAVTRRMVVPTKFRKSCFSGG